MIRNGLLVVVVLVLAGIVWAQSEKEGVISSTTEIVTVPVLVNDSSGKSVRGLKKEDFQIRDNGKDQRIASFEEVTATPVTISPSPEQNGIFTNRLSSDSPVALGILLIDLVNTQTVAQPWALQGAINFLNKWKGRGSFQQPMMVAALTSRGLRIIHQATSDPAVLEAALQLLSPQPATGADNKSAIESPVDPARGPDNQPIVVRQLTNESSEIYGKRLKQGQREAEIFDQMERSNELVRAHSVDADTTTTMWALMAISNGVAGIPGRKAMIWCSEAFPFRMVSGVFESPQWTAKHGSTYEDPALQPLRDAALLAFNRANIAVYPVSVAGLLSPDYFDASLAKRTMMTGPQWAGKAMQSQEVDMDNRDYARVLANKTAGTACMSSNDIGSCIGRALDDSTHYYMLSYYPDPKPKNTGYRKIKVDVKGEKLNVRARESYWHGPAPTYGSSPKSEVAVALGSNLEYTSLPIIFKFTGLKPGPQGKQMAEFVIGVDGRALSIDEEHDNHISLLIGAQAKAGDAPTVLAIDTKLKPELVPQIRAKQLTHKGEMELTPGKYEVRVVVRDNLSGSIGSVVAAIEVP